MAAVVDIRTDPVTGENVGYDAYGNEVMRWPAYGQAGAAMSTVQPGTTMIGPNGRLQAPTAPPIDPLTQQPKAPPAEAVPIEATPWGQGQRGGSSGGVFGRSSYGGSSTRSGGGVSSSGGYGGYGGGGSFGGAGQTIPRYGDGSTHPFFGGPPRVPGGVFAQGDDGFDDRVQVTSSSGATAGPYGVSAPDAPDSASYGGGGSSSGGGGGGGLAREMISRIGGNIRDKVSGMGPGGSPSTTTSDSYMRQQQRYKQQGRRLDRASDRYNEALGEPLNMPVVGWSKRQGYKPGSVAGALGSPGMILSDVFPGVSLNESTDAMTDLPMTDLAMLLAGTRGRGLMGKTPTVKVPGILQRQAGYDDIKPEFKRSLNPSKVVNKVAAMYKQLSEGGQLSTEQLLGNMAHTKKKSALGQGLAQQAEFDPGGAMGQIGDYVHAAFSPMGNSGPANAYQRQIDRELMALGPTMLRKKPERMHKAARQVANAFLA